MSPDPEDQNAAKLTWMLLHPAAEDEDEDVISNVVSFAVLCPSGSVCGPCDHLAPPSTPQVSSSAPCWTGSV